MLTPRTGPPRTARRPRPALRALRAASVPAALALIFALAPNARAQDGEPPPETTPAQPVETSPAQPAETTPAQPVDATPAQPAEAAAPAAPAASALPAPPPIMIVVLTSGAVPEPLLAAAQSALVDAITAMAARRPVHALGAPAIRDTIAACSDDACIGAQLAQAGAQAGVILRLRARGRRPLSATLEVRDPVSGTARSAPTEGTLPFDPAQIGEPTRALAEQQRSAMPPGPGSLLVTVDVDGASVHVDGHEIGESPVAPVEIAEGPHEIIVRRQGYLIMRRQARVLPGQQARVDVTLQPMDAGAGGGGGSQAAVGGGESGGGGGGGSSGGGDVTGEWWFWAAIGGGAAVILGIVIGVGVAATSGGAPGPQDPRGIELPPILGGTM